MSNSKVTKIFPLVFILLLATSTQLFSQSIGDYGSVGKGFWSQKNNWRIWNGSEFKTKADNPPGIGDNVFIYDDIDLDDNVTVRSLQIISKTLSFKDGGGTYTLNITENLSIGAGASFDMSSMKRNKVNNLLIGGNLTIGNNAIFDMQNAANSGRIANVTFTGTSNQIVTTSGTPATIRFSNITVDKGSDTTSTVDLNINPNLLGNVTLNNGTLITRAGSIPLANTSISASSRLIVAGTSSVVSPAGMNLRVLGEIQVLDAGSNFYLQSPTMPTRSDRSLSVEGNGSLKIYNGTLTIWGGLNLTGNSTSLINNGSILIDPRAVTTPLTRAQSMLSISENASFNGTGGQIQFAHFNQNTSGPAKTIDFSVNSIGSVNFSGTNILIGSGASTSTTAQGFELKINAPVRDLTVNIGESAIGNCILNDPTGELEVLNNLTVSSGTFTSTPNSTLTLNNPVLGTGIFDLDPLTKVKIKGNALSAAFRFSPNNPNQIKKLEIIDQAGTIQLGENLIVSDSLLLTNGNINLNGKRLEIPGYGFINSNQISGAGTIEINGKLALTNKAGYRGTGVGYALDQSSISSIVLGATSTIEYAAADTQFISGGQYQNLQSVNGGRRIFPSTDTIKIAAYFNPGSSAYSVNGSKVQYNGNIQQFLPNQFTFDTLIISSSYVPANQAVQIPSGQGNEIGVRGVIYPVTGHLITNGNLRLISDATSDGMIAKQFSPSAAVKGEIIQERFAAASAVAVRNIGVGTSGVSSSQLKNNYTPFVLSYDESVLGDRNQGYTWLDTGIIIEPGRGYYMYFPTGVDYTIESRGEAVSGTVNFPAISWTVDPLNRSASGWCIAANPYPCTIDWMASLGWTRNKISTTIFYLDPVTGQQASFNNGVGTNGATRYIQPGQGFWVKATGLAPSIMATEDVKVIVRDKFFKSNQDNELQLIKIGLLTPDHQDEAIIHLEKGRAAGFEPNEDTEAFPMELAPVPASLALIENFTDRLSINRVDEDSIWGHTFPLSIYQRTAGTSQLTLNEIPANFTGQIILTDILTNESMVLNTNNSFSWEVNSNDTGWIENRFVLRFVKEGQTIESINTSEIQLYPNPASSFTTIQWNENIQATQVEIISAVGQILSIIEVNPSQTTQLISLENYPTGIYWVKVSGNNNSATGRLIVK